MVAQKPVKHAENDSRMLSQKFLILLVIGFFTAFVGVIILMIATMLSNDSASFGVVIFIGPFPIVVGAGPEMTWMVLFSIVLAIISIVMFLLWNRRIKE